MKIGTILTATDLNPLYSDFIPIFIKAWNKIVPTANVIIILIANSIPDELIQYKNNIKLFNPMPNISNSFVSQCIRILYPRQVESNDGVLISDIDMIPLNKKYYVDSIKDIDNSTFISYRDVLGSEQIAICYNVATPEIWKSLIGNEDTKLLLENWYPAYNGISGGKGWYTDQEKLAEYYKKYNGNKIMLNDKLTGFNRLDRIDNIKISEKLKNHIYSGVYSDYHCMRPYQEFKELNDFVLNSLPQYGGRRKINRNRKSKVKSKKRKSRRIK
uniref:Glycosyltransferase n=1 Tax=viral metagenome TaxID=1070528 RepID=A0A6C0D5N8_9ZZZZ